MDVLFLFFAIKGRLTEIWKNTLRLTDGTGMLFCLDWFSSIIFTLCYMKKVNWFVSKDVILKGKRIGKSPCFAFTGSPMGTSFCSQ